MLTPVERLRPRHGITYIEYGADGKYVVRHGDLRMDPHVTRGERRFDHAMERLFVAAVWVGLIVGGWWVIIEGSKLVYAYAFHHPFGL